jgi:hypothetical protein
MSAFLSRAVNEFEYEYEYDGGDGLNDANSTGAQYLHNDSCWSSKTRRLPDGWMLTMCLALEDIEKATWE